MDLVVKQFGIYLVKLDPTVGGEINKTRPCMVISPNEMNKYLSTILIVPLTSTIRNYPTRINCTFENKHGQLVLDQIRSVDKIRLIKPLAIIKDKVLMQKTLKVLQEMFVYDD